MYLFGSYARGKEHPDSDIDVLIESEEELRQIPPELLMANGGPIDAFWMPNDDGWAEAIDGGKIKMPRMLLCWDREGSQSNPVPISANQLLCMCKNLNLNKKKE